MSRNFAGISASLICSVLSFSAFSASRNIETVAQACARARILFAEDLSLIPVEGKIQGPGINLCETPSTDPRHEELARLFGAIADQNELIEARTGISLKELVPAGFTIQLTQTAEGPLASAASYIEESESGYIQLGLYPGGKADGFHRGIYTHEMGHVVHRAWGERRKTPGITSFYDNKSLTEAFADLFAYTVMGSFIGEEAQLTGCFGDLRAYRQMISYRGPFYRFSSALLYSRVVSCCDKMSAQGSLLSPQQQMLCSEWSTPEMRTSLEKEVAAMATLSLVEKDRDIDEEKVSQLMRVLDEHQLGIPWATWVVDLAKIEGVSPFQYLVKRFESVRAEDLTSEARCGLVYRNHDGKTVRPADSLWAPVSFVSMKRVNEILLRDPKARRGDYQSRRFSDGEFASHILQLNWRFDVHPNVIRRVSAFASNSDVQECLKAEDPVLGTFKNPNCKIVCERDSLR